MEPTTTALPPHTPHETLAHTHPPVPATDVVPAVKPAPPIEDTDPPESETPPKNPHNHKNPPKNKDKKQAAAKQPNSGVGMAIAATVIIILGLAGLATYAFLKTQK